MFHISVEYARRPSGRRIAPTPIPASAQGGDLERADERVASSSMPRSCGRRCGTSTARWPPTRCDASTSTPAGPSLGGSATTRRRRRAARPGGGVLRRRRQPLLAAPPRTGRTGRRRRLRRRVRHLRRRRPGRADRRVVGVDMTAEMLDKSRATAAAARLRPRRVPRRPRRSAAGRGRLGRRGDLQRGDQPLRRQAGRVRRDLPGAATRRLAAVRRHRQRPPGPAGGDARHRPVDRLNCRRAAPCGLAEDARGHRLHRRRDRTRRSTPSAAPTARPRRAPTRCTATPSSPASRADDKGESHGRELRARPRLRRSRQLADSGRPPSATRPSAAPGTTCCWWTRRPATEAPPTAGRANRRPARTGCTSTSRRRRSTRRCARLEGLGAGRIEADAIEEHGNRWVVMADPEGNEFCVCDGGTSVG